MLTVLVQLIVALMVMGLLYYVITMLPLPAPFPVVLRVVFMVFCILVVLWIFLPGLEGSWGGRPALR